MSDLDLELEDVEEQPLDRTNQTVLLSLISSLFLANEEATLRCQKPRVSDIESKEFFAALKDKYRREKTRAAEAVAQFQEMKYLLARMQAEQVHKAECVKIEDMERLRISKQEMPKLQEEYESKASHLGILDEEIEELKRENAELTNEMKERNRLERFEGSLDKTDDELEALNVFIGFLDRMGPRGV
jgi:hypothetical protein